MIIKELDYVKTKSGKQGTIVMVFTKPDLAYEIEFDGANGETETVVPGEITEILKSYK